VELDQADAQVVSNLKEVERVFPVRLVHRANDPRVEPASRQLARSRERLGERSLSAELVMRCGTAAIQADLHVGEVISFELAELLERRCLGIGRRDDVFVAQTAGEADRVDVVGCSVASPLKIVSFLAPGLER
jgi:hypothetical protein